MNKLEAPHFRLTGKLTPEQVSFFDKYGILQLKSFIDKETILSFLEETKRVQHFLVEKGFRKINGIPLKFGKDLDGSTLIQRIAFTSYYSKVFADFLKDDRLKELLTLLGRFEGRIGEHEKDGLVFNHYINAEESNFRQLGWHTDSPRDLFLGSRILPMLNVGLHLDDCSFESGGLRVIPGTHKQNLFRLLFGKKYFIDNRTDDREVGFDIEAGDLTVHDGRLWHRVQRSSLKGAESRRRVLYFPIITGRFKPKNEYSPTPFYHKIGQMKWSGSLRPVWVERKNQLRNNNSR